MLQLFGVLSGLLPILGTFPYLRDIADGKTKPHRISFLIWSILGTIAVFTQLADGARWSLVFPAVDAALTLLIFFMAARKGVDGFTKLDIGGLVLALIGLVLWYLTKQPLTALCITVAVDMVGTVLTVHKTYLHPESETFSSWFLCCAGSVFAALAVGKWSFALLLYPVYLTLANGAVAVVIKVGRKPQHVES